MRKAKAKPVVAWVIYCHPTDYPEHFVVRRHALTARSRDCLSVVYGEARLFTNLADARAVIPQGLQRFGRQKEDQRSIVETWL